jgi:hypothetical protein
MLLNSSPTLFTLTTVGKTYSPVVIFVLYTALLLSWISVKYAYTVYSVSGLKFAN